MISNFSKKTPTKYVYRNRLEGELTEIQVYYSKGGNNYFSGCRNPRGIYVSIGPVTIKDHCVSFTLMSGKSFFVQELKASSPKKLEAFAEWLDANIDFIAGMYEDNKEDGIETIRGLVKRYQQILAPVAQAQAVQS